MSKATYTMYSRNYVSEFFHKLAVYIVDDNLSLNSYMYRLCDVTCDSYIPLSLGCTSLPHPRLFYNRCTAALVEEVFERGEHRNND